MDRRKKHQKKNPSKKSKDKKITGTERQKKTRCRTISPYSPYRDYPRQSCRGLRIKKILSPQVS